MEYALEAAREELKIAELKTVLILVLMEYALEVSLVNSAFNAEGDTS